MIPAADHGDGGNTPPNAVRRLRPLWYAPIFNVPCWFSLFILSGNGVVRLLSPPLAEQSPFTPYALIIGGLLFPLWHFYAACSPTTFLELSRLGFRRNVCGRGASWRWDQVASFKLRSLGGRSGSWVSAELSPNLPGSVGDQSGVTAVRIEGKWTTFLFGGLDDSIVERLNAWRAWATSDPTTPPPSLEPARHELFPLVVVFEIWLGILVCLALSSFLATRAPGGFVNVLAGLMSFALCGLLFAPLAVITVGPTRIRERALAWQLGWIAFVLVASWLGHLVIGFFPAFRQMPPLR